jgi:hypothetical protein
MEDWRSQLKFDPIPPLLSSQDDALLYFVRRDLLGEEHRPVQCLWELPGPQKILKKQLADGSWPRLGENKHQAINYRLVETWRQFRLLVEQSGFTRDHPKARQAAEFLFSCQTEAGDIRGILANQYATYYTGAILATLIQAGYEEDMRVEKGLQWLLAMRQADGGWTIPILTHKLDRATQYHLTTQFEQPLEPNRDKPFSHHWTGMVLRAFALHPKYRNSKDVQQAAALLKSRFFQPDSYTSYQAVGYWVRFEYPYWWNNLLSALDSLSRIGLTIEDEQIRQALDWFIEHQEDSGLWKVSYMKGKSEIEKDTPNARQRKEWVSFEICRVFNRLFR